MSEGPISPNAETPIDGQGAPPPAAGSGAGPTLSIVALVLAGVAFVTSFLGIFAFVSWIFGLPAFIVGIAALVKKAQKRPLAIVAMIVSVVAFLISIVVFVVALVADDGPSSEARASGHPELNFGEVEFWKEEVTEKWSFFTIVDNPSADHRWDSLQFQVDAFDADGDLLTSNFTFATILPGESALVWGRYLDVGDAQVAAVDIYVDERKAESAKTYVGDTERGTIVFDEPEVVDDGRTIEVSGTFESTFAEDILLFEVVVVVRDGAGDIVDMRSQHIQNVTAGGVTEHNATFWGFELDDSMTIEVYGDHR